MKKVPSRGEEIYSEDVFQVLLEYEITRSNRYPAPLALLHIEMTPTAMDEETLLVAPSLFASALNAHLRSVDIPSGAKREYRILLPTTDSPGAHTVCDRLLSIFKNRLDTKDGKSIAFTLNIGAATHSGGTSLTRQVLYEQADSALKQSKIKGSNTCVFFNDI